MAHYPGAYPPGAYPPGTAMPGAYPGAMPGAYPGAMPGAMPGAYPGAMPGAYPGGVPAGGKPNKKAGKAGKKNKANQPASAYQNKWYAAWYNQIQPHELQSLQGWFAAIDLDKSGTITAQELSQAPWPGGISFDPTTCYKLVRTFDNDWSGTITFYEFAALFKFVLYLQQVFAASDRDRSGTLEPVELQFALTSAGFQVDEMSVRPYLKRFQANQVNISFSSYVALCVQLAHARSMFEKYDTTHTGRITLDLPQYFRVILAHSE